MLPLHAFCMAGVARKGGLHLVALRVGDLAIPCRQQTHASLCVQRTAPPTVLCAFAAVEAIAFAFCLQQRVAIREPDGGCVIPRRRSG